MLTASYLYILCQALDLRALRKELNAGLGSIISEELESVFGDLSTATPSIKSNIFATMRDTLDKTSTMDVMDQMRTVADSSTNILVDALTSSESSSSLSSISTFRKNVASRAATLYDQLRGSYLSGERGAAPASAYLGKTRAVYEYIRVTLGIRMHGSENYSGFANGLGSDDVTLGQNISTIHEVSIHVSYAFGPIS